MTLTNNITAKFAVAAVAVAMAFSAFAPAAQAQTTEELQQMINDLLSQVAQLQAQAGGDTSGSSSSDVCPYTWTRDLTQGSEGADVMKLQQFLNENPDTRVAPAGSAGSAGMETMYYGPATAAAVNKFQVMYRAEILTPNGLVNPTGYFGPSSRAQANDLCVTPVTTPDEDEDEDGMEDEDEEDEDEDFVLGGIANLDDFEMDDADDTDVEEGENDVEVGVATLEFSNGDAEISILDIALTSSDSNANPWDAFDTLSLWVDGDMVAEVDASDEDDYLDEDDGTLRFSNLGLIAEEDEEVEIVIGASIQNNLDGEELSTWTITPDRLRFFDADGVAITETGSILDGTSQFLIEEAGEGEELNFSLSSNNPDATDIVVDETSTTNDVTILEYTIEAEEGDIEVDRLVVRIDTPNTATRDVVNDVELVIDGQSFRDESFGTLPNESQASTTGNFAWYVFDIDGDIVIDEDEEVDAEVVVDFKRQDGNYPNGQTIKASVTSDERDLTVAEGADDLGTADFSGTAVGDTHTLVAEGIVVDAGSFDSSFSTQGQDNTIGIFTVDFDVTAVEGDFYIADAASTGTAATTGVEFTVDGPATPTSAGAVLSSTGDENQAGDAFVVREGETETITLTVTVDASQSGQHRIVLGTVNFTSNEDGVTGTEAYSPLPVTDFRTSFGNINEI